MLTTCGVNCLTDCRAFGTDCEGCNELNGKVSWATFYGQEECPIYSCAKLNGFTSCAQCGKAPCEVWFKTRNPDASDEEFQADISSRLRNLQKK